MAQKKKEHATIDTSLTLVYVGSYCEGDNSGLLLERLFSAASKRPNSSVTRQSAPEIDPPALIESPETLRRHIFKFVRRQDQYMALASVLLKSRSYHESRSKVWARPTSLLPVVSLPRSPHGKPFIPPPRGWIGDSDFFFPFSISHQYPFVGMACFRDRPNTLRISLGIDIVVFDDINSNLYHTADEFLDAFQDSFTLEEWLSIQSSPTTNAKLKEFYLRWAAKEAYTKALGVGLGFAFNSFHMKFEEHSLWDTLHTLDQARRSFDTTALVRSEERAPEHWWVRFERLPAGGELSYFAGCCCLCAGPWTRDIEKPRVFIQWESLESI